MLSTDYLLREQFVTDPAQIMSDYVFGERLTEEASDAANQLLFAVDVEPSTPQLDGHRIRNTCAVRCQPAMSSRSILLARWQPVVTDWPHLH